MAAAMGYIGGIPNKNERSNGKIKPAAAPYCHPHISPHKNTGKCRSLIVTGCLAQRYSDEIFKEIPEVDAILGTNSYDSIVEAVKQTLEKKTYKNLHTLEGLPTDDPKINGALYRD